MHKHQYLWQKDNKYYKLHLQANLFGGDDIICCWGRYGSKFGGYKIITCDTQTQLEMGIDKVRRRRKTRGYLLIQGVNA